MNRRLSALPPLLLTLLVGVALGWALNDMTRPGESGLPTSALPQPPVAAQPSIVPTTPPTATPAPTSAPTAMPPPTLAPPTATPAPTAAPAPEIVGYKGHVVAEGETLEQIAANGGSTPELIAAYNLLAAAPRPGRALIVPQIAGQVSVLADTPIMVRSGPSTRRLIALTLDAGAGSEPTGRMLDALREREVRITFFLTGRWIRENPDLTRRMVAEGHELANHTFSHPDLTAVDDAAIRRELTETEAALRDVAPGATLRPFFRPPYGAYDERVQRVVQSAGYLPVYWTLDSLDSVGEPKTPVFLLERVTGKLSPDELRGAIILAHCGSDATAEALPAILDRFEQMGFTIAPLSAVLQG